MNLRTVVASATTAALLSTGGVAIAGAASSSSPSSSPGTAATVAAPEAKSSNAAHAHRRARRHHRIRVFVRKVVLDTIGIDRQTLRRELRSGKTIGEIATAHGVEPSAVIDALVSAANTKLDAAVSAGKLEAERAEKIKAKLPARFTKLVNEWHPRRLRNAAS